MCCLVWSAASTEAPAGAGAAAASLEQLEAAPACTAFNAAIRQHLFAAFSLVPPAASSASQDSAAGPPAGDKPGPPVTLRAAHWSNSGCGCFNSKVTVDATLLQRRLTRELLELMLQLLDFPALLPWLFEAFCVVGISLHILLVLHASATAKADANEGAPARTPAAVQPPSAAALRWPLGVEVVLGPHRRDCINASSNTKSNNNGTGAAVLWTFEGSASAQLPPVPRSTLEAAAGFVCTSAAIFSNAAVAAAAIAEDAPKTAATPAAVAEDWASLLLQASLQSWLSSLPLMSLLAASAADAEAYAAMKAYVSASAGGSPAASPAAVALSSLRQLAEACGIGRCSLSGFRVASQGLAAAGSMCIAALAAAANTHPRRFLQQPHQGEQAPVWLVATAAAEAQSLEISCREQSGSTSLYTADAAAASATVATVSGMHPRPHELQQGLPQELQRRLQECPLSSCWEAGLMLRLLKGSSLRCHAFFDIGGSNPVALQQHRQQQPCQTMFPWHLLSKIAASWMALTRIMESCEGAHPAKCSLGGAFPSERRPHLSPGLLSSVSWEASCCLLKHPHVAPSCADTLRVLEAFLAAAVRAAPFEELRQLRKTFLEGTLPDAAPPPSAVALPAAAEHTEEKIHRAGGLSIFLNLIITAAEGAAERDGAASGSHPLTSRQTHEQQAQWVLQVRQEQLLLQQMALRMIEETALDFPLAFHAQCCATPDAPRLHQQHQQQTPAKADIGITVLWFAAAALAGSSRNSISSLRSSEALAASVAENERQLIQRRPSGFDSSAANNADDGLLQLCIGETLQLVPSEQQHACTHVGCCVALSSWKRGTKRDTRGSTDARGALPFCPGGALGLMARHVDLERAAVEAVCDTVATYAQLAAPAAETVLLPFVEELSQFVEHYLCSPEMAAAAPRLFACAIALSCCCCGFPLYQPNQSQEQQVAHEHKQKATAAAARLQHVVQAALPPMLLLHPMQTAEALLKCLERGWAPHLVQGIRAALQQGKADCEMLQLLHSLAQISEQQCASHNGIYALQQQLQVELSTQEQEHVAYILRRSRLLDGGSTRVPCAFLQPLSASAAVVAGPLGATDAHGAASITPSSTPGLDHAVASVVSQRLLQLLPLMPSASAAQEITVGADPRTRNVNGGGGQRQHGLEGTKNMAHQRASKATIAGAVVQSYRQAGLEQHSGGLSFLRGPQMQISFG
ncbi:hypothetical protein cyc_05803 [Cyclospora cayetanensis]|uniref:Uncharacterized protein n=1 Tax=Cyclospora cayetanensis TaxID=88456 RepID=A0A1D3CVL2_9EIME|nr:hypothetical protein cyc_05803 [Cyclospora cayetanensis]